ncbi:hypothetical protein ACTMU2_01620 [Cupriavidus basilensis]
MQPSVDHVAESQVGDVQPVLVCGRQRGHGQSLGRQVLGNGGACAERGGKQEGYQAPGPAPGLPLRTRRRAAGVIHDWLLSVLEVEPV